MTKRSGDAAAIVPSMAERYSTGVGGLVGELWDAVFSWMATADMPAMARSCRTFHSALCGQKYLFAAFVHATNIDDAVLAAMLACAAPSLDTLVAMRGVPRTPLLERAAMPWFWTTVFRRLVCRQLQLPRGSRLFLPPENTVRWSELCTMFEQDGLVPGGPCVLRAAAAADNTAIVHRAADSTLLGIDVPAHMAETWQHVLATGGRAVAQMMGRDPCRESITQLDGGTSLPIESDWTGVFWAYVAGRYDQTPASELFDAFDHNGLCELTAAAICFGRMHDVRRFTGELRKAGDFVALVEVILNAVSWSGHEEGIHFLLDQLPVIGTDCFDWVGVVRNLLAIGDHLALEQMAHKCGVVVPADDEGIVHWMRDRELSATGVRRTLKAMGFYAFRLAWQSCNPMCMRFVRAHCTAEDLQLTADNLNQLCETEHETMELEALAGPLILEGTYSAFLVLRCLFSHRSFCDHILPLFGDGAAAHLKRLGGDCLDRFNVNRFNLASVAEMLVRYCPMEEDIAKLLFALASNPRVARASGADFSALLAQFPGCVANIVAETAIRNSEPSPEAVGE